MKKILWAALASLITPAATAATTAIVSSNVTGLQLWYDTDNWTGSGKNSYYDGIEFGGTATDVDGDHIIDSTNLTFSGRLGFDLYQGLAARLDFGLTGGVYYPGSGVVFQSGSIVIDVFFEGSWQPYNTIDAATDYIPFIRSWGFVLHDPNQMTAGLVSNRLPGLWDGQIDGVGYDSAASIMMLFGLNTGLFLDGTITTMAPDGTQLYFSAADMPATVPVPAAAWLFGSALGCVGVLRRRTAK